MSWRPDVLRAEIAREFRQPLVWWAYAMEVARREHVQEAAQARYQRTEKGRTAAKRYEAKRRARKLAWQRARRAQLRAEVRA